MKIESWEIQMTTATVAVDPGEAIAAAMRDLYDQLREIVDRGPTDDPGLLDELGKLTGRIRARITRARKRAEPAEEQPAPKPAGDASCEIPQKDRPCDPSSGAISASSVLPVAPPSTTTAADSEAPRRREASAETATDPRDRAAAVPARRTGEVTVRLPRTTAARGRHRLRPARLPLWVHALAVLLIVGGVALGTAVTDWGFGLAPAGLAVLGMARRWSIRRQVRGDAR